MYTKLFSSITDSTIWREPNHVRILWITLLAKCDAHGCIWASVPGIADAARLDLPLCQDAFKVLMSPDPWSRSKEEDGKRIKEIDGGWQLINHSKYKAIRSSEERKEYKRLKQQEYREKT